MLTSFEFVVMLIEEEIGSNDWGLAADVKKNAQASCFNDVSAFWICMDLKNCLLKADSNKL